MIKDKRRYLKNIGTVLALTGSMVLLNRWDKPIVDAILLPAHATTTGLCSMDEIAGDWLLLLGDLRVKVSLAADWTGNAGELSTARWSLTGKEISIVITTQPSGKAREYKGEISQPCSTFQGISNTQEPFTARKTS